MPGALKNAYLPSFYEIWSADRIDLLFSEPVPPTYSHWNYAVTSKMGDLTPIRSVRSGPRAANRSKVIEVELTGNVSALTDPVMTTEGVMMVLPDGVFSGNLRVSEANRAGPGGAVCHEVVLNDRGNSVLRLEQQVLERALGTDAAGLSKALLTYFAVGSRPQFGRGRGCGNFCAATPRRQSLHRFSSLYAGTTREGETWEHKAWATPRIDQPVEMA